MIANILEALLKIGSRNNRIGKKGFEGFSVGKKEEKLGIRASSTTELVMSNCVVPKENLIGQEGKGFGIAMKTLDGGRIGIAAQALGIAEGAFEERPHQ